jgi:hypothetical protein
VILGGGRRQRSAFTLVIKENCGEDKEVGKGIGPVVGEKTSK